MWLEAIITREDLVHVLGEILPVKIHLDDDNTVERWLWLGRAEELTLVPDEGLRVTCAAELCWSIAGMSPSAKIEKLGVLIRPQISETDKGHLLEFKIEIEEADFSALPAFVDSTIAKAVNVALSAKGLTWNFTETLTREVLIPRAFKPVEALKIGVAWGKTRINAEALVLVVSFKMGVVRAD